MIVAQREKRSGLWLALLFGVLGGLGIGAWHLYSERAATVPIENKPSAVGQNPMAPVPPPSQAAPPVASADVRTIEVATDSLKGEGVELAAWVAKIRSLAPSAIRFDPPDLPARFGHVRICDYEGDATLSIQHALELLRYTGMTVTPENEGRSFVLRAADTQNFVDELLSSHSNPDNMEWGVFKPWARFSLRDATESHSLLKDVSENPNPQRIAELSTALNLLQCRIDNGGDNRILVSRKVPRDLENFDFIAARMLLTRDFEKNGKGIETVRELGWIARTATHEIISDFNKNCEQAVETLALAAQSKDAETARAAAWALGQTTLLSAYEVLLDTLDKSNDPLLTRTALAAICHSQQTIRRQGIQPEHWDSTRRNADNARLLAWLAKASQNPAPELAATLEFAAGEFGPPNATEPVPNAASPLRFASPNWRRFTMEADDAIALLRSNDPRSVITALWRWNRPGADKVATPPLEGSSPLLFDLMTKVLATSRSGSVRRLALEALYRPGEKRGASAGTLALIENPALALSVFLRDPDARVQRSAAAILSRSAGIVQINTLRQSLDAAHPPAGTDVLLLGLVERFWKRSENPEEESPALDALIEMLLSGEDVAVADRAAWAKVQNPKLDIEAKLRATKAFKRPSQRVAGLQAIARLPEARSLNPKFVSVFSYDSDAAVREAVFTEKLLSWIEVGPEYIKICERGIEDPSAQVRLAMLKSREAATKKVRDVIVEKIKAASERDESAEVRAAAKSWLSAK